MNTLKVEKDICDRCGQCLSVCPSGAIKTTKKAAVIDGELCNNCYLCLIECTKNAIVNSMDQKKYNSEEEVNLKICIFIEHKDGEIVSGVLEVFYCARELRVVTNYQIVGILVGKDLSNLSEKVLEYELDEVWTCEDQRIDANSEELIIDSVTQIVQIIKPTVLLASGSILGRSVMPRISSRLNTGLCADCVRFEFDESQNNINIVRPAYSGKIMAKIAIPYKRPQMATVKPNVFPQVEKGQKKGIRIDISQKINLNQPLITVIKSTDLNLGPGDLEKAKIVVGFGLGVKDNKTIKLIYEFADLLGASVGATRAVVDAGWIGSEWQIGQSGKIIKPDIYIACGISGAVQHLIGIKDAGMIISINSNKSAPIVDVSSYAMIGDLEEIIAEFIKVLRKKKK